MSSDNAISFGVTVLAVGWIHLRFLPSSCPSGESIAAFFSFRADKRAICLRVRWGSRGSRRLAIIFHSRFLSHAMEPGGTVPWNQFEVEHHISPDGITSTYHFREREVIGRSIRSSLSRSAEKKILRTQSTYSTAIYCLPCCLFPSKFFEGPPR